VNKAFVAAFKAKYNELPDQYCAQGYDGMKLAAEALRGATTIDRASIKDALTKVKYDGVMGPFSFGPDREPAATGGVLTFEVTDGAFKIVN
jgi:branched-chain amino acid transport system substrate-binding protein